jgi:hypothetical protein
MILYQLAKWMEERDLLQRSIRRGEGDTLLLLQQKEQVEAQLLAQARTWLAASTGFSEIISHELISEEERGHPGL